MFFVFKLGNLEVNIFLIAQFCILYLQIIADKIN